MPIGAEVQPGGTDFRIWAPRLKSVLVELCASEGNKTECFEMEPEEGGYFRASVPSAQAGMRYSLRTSSGTFADPASRYQPEGPHGPSQIVDPGSFHWLDGDWRGLPESGRVIYEMHIGTFTPEGTWDAAAEQLHDLARLGVNVLEIMPVADFPGRFGWGYDGVNLFAPTRLYGKPDEFRAFVNQAHQLGLAVILDVVYNHLGPDGNSLREFSTDYFTDRHKNEWGDAINFDGPNSGPVREFFLANAEYWIEEFHLDGLRLDATQQMFDSSAENIQAAITRRVKAAAKGRRTFVVAENELQQSRLARASEAGGYGIDALWNDDFHHSAMAALTGRAEAYYTDYRGTPQEFISSVKWGFLYQGQWYSWQKKRRGTRTAGLERHQFIHFLQNHDQVANSLHGKRIHELASPGELRALTALLLLGPATPMLFQGQEFAASSPFLYFADHKPELARLVAGGRREFLRQFPALACPENDSYLAGPDAMVTFVRSKLNRSEKEHHKEAWQLHHDLLGLRRQDAVFSHLESAAVDGAVLGLDAFLLRFSLETDERLLLINLGLDLLLSPAPEPLLAPTEGCTWRILWSSEWPGYGGSGTPPFDLGPSWRLPGRCAIVLAPCPMDADTTSF